MLTRWLRWDIGEDVDIAQHVTILTGDHDADSPDYQYRHRPVVIGNRCWIATGATLLPGTVLSDGAVAHGHFAGFAIHVGNPPVSSANATRRPATHLPVMAA